MNDQYKRQVFLLLSVLPEVSRENCFALHGGTAINLFIREMPRLSVDIDLTYIPLENRQTSLNNVSNALERISARISSALPTSDIRHQKETSKLQISRDGVQIKLEVNQTNRGILEESSKLMLCEKVQEEFDAFCAIQVVHSGQLFGGKICAAIDRQHPRDLFDIKFLLENEGFTNDIKTGFLLSLLGSNRPIHELIDPNFLDQRYAFANQFEGLSIEPFTYSDYESTRTILVDTIKDSLTNIDKEFLLSFKSLEPDWSLYNFERFPSIQWKLENLQRLQRSNRVKHQEQYDRLKQILDTH